jgi:hypothetical protein
MLQRTAQAEAAIAKVCNMPAVPRAVLFMVFKELLQPHSKWSASIVKLKYPPGCLQVRMGVHREG